MKRSNFFIPTLKENPIDAKIVSHRLMLRSGMIRQSSSGIYSWLPLGLLVLKNIENIIIEEQNKISQQMLMPTIQDANIWKKSGRYNDYGKEMLKIIDRNDRELLYDEGASTRSGAKFLPEAGNQRQALGPRRNFRPEARKFGDKH